MHKANLRENLTQKLLKIGGIVAKGVQKSDGGERTVPISEHIESAPISEQKFRDKASQGDILNGLIKNYVVKNRDGHTAPDKLQKITFLLE